MQYALIGHTGFVGSTLLRQGCFQHATGLDVYRSTNIEELTGRSYDVIICAGAPAQKWLANKEPKADKKNIERLISCLEKAKTQHFILISTVDVFKDPSTGCDEQTSVDEAGLHPYGLHRRMLERFVEAQYTERLVVRLPGLVGPGLRKNVIYDLLHDNNIAALNARSKFQYYPMVNLRSDIESSWKGNLKLVHLVSEPITTFEVADAGFGKMISEGPGKPISYDVRSAYTGGRCYQYDKQATLLAIRAYAQGEPLANAAIHI